MRTVLSVLIRIPRPSPAMGVALLALLIAASGAAVAAIPSNGTITACRDNKTGVLRIIDTADMLQGCTGKETRLVWKDGITGKVANSDLLDGKDFADFYAAGSTVANSDKLDNKDSTEFLGANQKAADSDNLDGKSGEDFYAVGSKVADSAHADQADFATSAGDANTLGGKDSTQFADATHAHSGADITSGTVDADRIEDGSGSNLDADTIDGMDSLALQRRVSASCDPDSAIRAIGDNGTVTREPDDTSSAQDMASLPAVKARSSNLVVNDATHTPFELNFEDFDQVGDGETFGMTEMHSDANSDTTNNYEFVAPRAGIYEVQVEVIWAPSSAGATGTGERRVALRKNWTAGTCGEGSFDDMDVQYADPGERLTSHVSTLLAMDPGSNVFFCGYQNSGENLNIDFVFASMHYVSGQ